MAEAEKTPVIVDASGKPARKAADRNCPRCGHPETKRRRSGGFGAVHDVCGECGYEWQESTV